GGGEHRQTGAVARGGPVGECGRREEDPLVVSGGEGQQGHKVSGSHAWAEASSGASCSTWAAVRRREGGNRWPNGKPGNALEENQSRNGNCSPRCRSLVQLWGSAGEEGTMYADQSRRMLLVGMLFLLGPLGLSLRAQADTTDDRLTKLEAAVAGLKTTVSQ